MTTTAQTYMTRDGDTADSIAYAYYGYTSGSTEAILAANKGLAALDAVLPAGLKIVLPALNVPGTGSQAAVTQPNPLG